MPTWFTVLLVIVAQVGLFFTGYFVGHRAGFLHGLKRTEDLLKEEFQQRFGGRND